MKYAAYRDGSMESFKTGEKVLTWLERLDYTGFLEGLRIIGRLYPIQRGQIAWNPLLYKGFKLILHRVGIQKGRWYFERNKILRVFVSRAISICYDLFNKVGMLKLLSVLTCKLFPCVYIARAVGKTGGCIAPHGGVGKHR